MNPTLSPCIGVCSTGIGDSVCRGCKRYMHEIVQWNAYSVDEKRAILDRIDHLLAQVVQPKIAIVNEKKLLTQLQSKQVRFNSEGKPYAWVFALLKAGATQIQDFSDFGCRVLPEFAECSLAELRDKIDEDFYVLSSVHHQRYFEIEAQVGETDTNLDGSE